MGGSSSTAEDDTSIKIVIVRDELGEPLELELFGSMLEVDGVYKVTWVD